ncbi:MAG: hypothetical protein EPN89_14580 [Methylovulum sp.]|nr:MAG: hypothetical protein EPN89_14580 [Methylovulum sp.]
MAYFLTWIHHRLGLPASFQRAGRQNQGTENRQFAETCKFVLPWTLISLAAKNTNSIPVIIPVQGRVTNNRVSWRNDCGNNLCICVIQCYINSPKQLLSVGIFVGIAKKRKIFYAFYQCLAL